MHTYTYIITITLTSTGTPSPLTTTVDSLRYCKPSRFLKHLFDLKMFGHYFTDGAGALEEMPKNLRQNYRQLIFFRNDRVIPSKRKIEESHIAIPVLAFYFFKMSS